MTTNILRAAVPLTLAWAAIGLEMAHAASLHLFA